jgi:hypothetical protein
MHDDAVDVGIGRQLDGSAGDHDHLASRRLPHVLEVVRSAQVTQDAITVLRVRLARPTLEGWIRSR